MTSASRRTRALVLFGAGVAALSTVLAGQTPAPSAPRSVLGTTPPPQNVPAPAPATDRSYAPQALLAGGVVVPLFPPGSPYLNAAHVKEPEVYTMTGAVPGRVASIVGIHNPSIELHRVPGSLNTGAAVILVAGGG